MNKAPRIIWSIRDGKAGHLSQISGLVQALNALEPVQEYRLNIPTGSPLFAWVGKSFPNPENHPKPDLLIGAGHRTHLAVLAAKRTMGGRSIILMNPSLPRMLFDLCIIPKHDNVPAGKNVFLTNGAINPIQYAINKDTHKGLILIGGSSRYYNWDNEAVGLQILSVLKKETAIRWTILTSRRTPTNFSACLGSIKQPFTILSPEECSSKQFKKLLEESGTVWATQDSVSMIYEALTSGAAVGIIDLQPKKKQGRPIQAIQNLITGGWVTRHIDWLSSPPLTLPPEQLNEAARCAKEIKQRWPNH